MIQTAVQDYLIENLARKTSYFPKAINKTTVKHHPNYVAVNCNLPTYNLNVITLRNNQFKMFKESLMDEIIAFTNESLPMSMWCWERYSEVCEYVKEIGLTEYHTAYAAMAAKVNDLQHHSSNIEGFQIKQITTKKEVKQFAAIIASLYDKKEGKAMQQQYEKIADLPLEGLSDTQLYGGFYLGEMVSTGSLFFHDQTVGVYDIATLASMRGKGFGSAIVYYLIEQVKQSNALYSVLEASPDGLGIYKRIGFHPVGNLKLFVNKNLIS
ncbi:GNAT family N-acetyltransferase [Oceanobacillus halotolerans]|uniref:GNAT family N-acetyltransferase n=1 Tax=Oceanobacillus halotolerans TaxID=2663380 RepID=UPI0013DBE5FA|nr:GNAT family N-acetyltransferase [Oceanobacillus halotolerans]